MDLIMSFLHNGTWGPFKDFLDLMSLPPERIREWLMFLIAFMILCELTRLALATLFTRSVLAHVLRCLLTFGIQAVVLAAVLVGGLPPSRPGLDQPGIRAAAVRDLVSRGAVRSAGAA